MWEQRPVPCSHTKWHPEQGSIVGATVLGALCPGSLARGTAGFIFIYCVVVFIRLSEGSEHYSYLQKAPRALMGAQRPGSTQGQLAAGESWCSAMLEH